MALSKIANDVRLLASGPRCGLGELRLPALQPGSSIMPGKVNPVICEVGDAGGGAGDRQRRGDRARRHAGQLELNAMIPLIARNLLESIRLLANASQRVRRALSARGSRRDRERAAALVEESLAMVTALVPAIGYDRAAEIAKEAAATGRTVREVALERGVLPAAELERLLDPRRLS